MSRKPYDLLYGDARLSLSEDCRVGILTPEIALVLGRTWDISTLQSWGHLNFVATWADATLPGTPPILPLRELIPAS